MALGEFQMIDRLLKPLASGFGGALGLSDDAAIVDPPPGCQIVIAKDAIVENVHFLSSDPPDTIARKLLRQNLSDLAAMGATPWAYLTVIGRRRDMPEDWLEVFVGGLADDQTTFGLHLIGGDTVSTPGPLFFTLTILGTVPKGTALTRAGARPGDLVCVSGSLGDGALGLQVLKGASTGSGKWDDYLIQRYRIPTPRLALGQALRGLATACMDVSDGLIGDLRHILETSGDALGSPLSAVIRTDALPISDAARAMPGCVAAAAGGGDDYELLFTVPPGCRAALANLPVAVTTIGEVTAGGDIRLIDADGRAVFPDRSSWTHF